MGPQAPPGGPALERACLNATLPAAFTRSYAAARGCRHAAPGSPGAGACCSSSLGQATCLRCTRSIARALRCPDDADREGVGLCAAASTACEMRAPARCTWVAQPARLSRCAGCGQRTRRRGFRTRVGARDAQVLCGISCLRLRREYHWPDAALSRAPHWLDAAADGAAAHSEGVWRPCRLVSLPVDSHGAPVRCLLSVQQPAVC